MPSAQIAPNIETSDSDHSSLEGLAVQINAEHGNALRAAGTAIEHAIRVGELLTEAKNNVRHGEWLSWVTGNLSFKERQARKYIQIFDGKAAIESNRTCNADLGIDSALKLLASPTPKHADDYNRQRRLQVVRTTIQRYGTDVAINGQHTGIAGTITLPLHQNEEEATDAEKLVTAKAEIKMLTERIKELEIELAICKSSSKEKHTDVEATIPSQELLGIVKTFVPQNIPIDSETKVATSSMRNLDTEDDGWGVSTPPR